MRAPSRPDRLPERTPHRRRRITEAALAFSLTLAGCHARGPKAPSAAGPTHQKKSSASDRRALAITVYNDDLGLVREVREVQLGTGRVSLDYHDVSAHIQPETVHIRSLSSPGKLDVLEQNYRYDLLTPHKLLEKYVGKKVKVYRYNQETGREREFDAKVLSVQGDGPPVLELGGQVTYGFNGRIAFPKIPDNLIPKPTLVWLLASGAARQKVEVTYLTHNLSWKADYVLVIDKSDARGDLTGWVTLTNNTGTSYQDARLKLVAGDVHRVMPLVRRTRVVTDTGITKSAPQFKEEGFFEYHLYTLQRPTSLLDKEQKQVSLLAAHGIHVDKKLIYFGAEGYFRGRYGEVEVNKKVGVYLDIKNSAQNHMGMPLPKGTVRVYKKDQSGAEEFVGEDSIDHTPRDERLRIKMGEAFDVVGERKQTAWHTLGMCASESAWQIEIRNHKDTPVVVEDYEPVGGDWTIVESSQPYQKKDAHTFTFQIRVPARAKTDVTYRVRVRWC